jgi:protein TonB
MKNLLCIFIFSISFFVQSQEKKIDSIYNYEDVTLKPNFTGGIENFYKFIAKNYLIPGKLNTKVKVQTEFVIEKDGSISNINIVQDPGYGTGEEAKKVLKKSPKWNPGEKDGVLVRTKYKFPITLQNAN